LGARPRERDSAIGAILAFGLGMGVLLLGYYHGFATAATNILFGNIFGVSGSQLLVLVAIGAVVVAVMGIWCRPLLFASMDPEVAEARGVLVRRLGLLFLLVLALTVTGAAQVVGTLLVLSLAITPGAAAQRLSANPLRVGVLSVLFAVVAAPRLRQPSLSRTCCDTRVDKPRRRRSLLQVAGAGIPVERRVR
jgi:zinc/manganese transport system permease protein